MADVNVGSAYVAVRAKSDHLKRDLDAAERTLGNSVSSMSRKIAGIGVAGIAVGVAAAATAAITTLRFLTAGAVTLANEQEAVMTRVNSVIRSTGGAAGSSLI